ncbi:MAG: methylamine utilization protein, partial [Phenylobacterium sp.]|nr:methylamine utilization protein [Phenylobacterium sp.]
MRAIILAALAALTLASQAAAGDLSVVVRDAAGHPVKDAVVTLKPMGGGATGAPIKFTWPYSVAQQNISFNPFVLIVPAGSSVTFPNKDKVRHHVYSFSPTKKFELKLYGRDESRS